MKIAFQIMGNDSWYAGVAHPKSILRALRYSRTNELTLCLLAPNSNGSIPDVLRQEVDEVINFPKFRRWTMEWVLDQAMKYAFKKNVQEERNLKQHKVDVVFGHLIRDRYTKIPTLSWIPDFQHVHFPEMFSLQERLQRDRAFLRIAKSSTRVILMSEAVKKDYQRFTPKYAHKARVLRTASYIPNSIYESDSKSVLNLYHLPEKFIYLPNQFWKHKNHKLVFQALKILKDKGLEIFIVCSGYPGDYRHAGYFASLFQKLSEWGIRNQVIYLGMLPYEHVLLLMRQSICVLNPSLFEGFGLAVDEARTVGKQVLLSDIPAHREQNPPKATFFNLYDCEDLAKKLDKIWLSTSPGPDIELELQARQILPERLHECAESFLSVVREMVGQ